MWRRPGADVITDQQWPGHRFLPASWPNPGDACLSPNTGSGARYVAGLVAPSFTLARPPGSGRTAGGVTGRTGPRGRSAPFWP